MEKFNVFIVNEDLSKSLLIECASEEEALSVINEKKIQDETITLSLEFENDFGTVVVF